MDFFELPRVKCHRIFGQKYSNIQALWNPVFSFDPPSEHGRTVQPLLAAHGQFCPHHAAIRYDTADGTRPSRKSSKAPKW
jgi:hypothetical protein